MPTPTEELRRRIVADINAGAPGTKLGSERELAERYGDQPLQPAPGARGAGGGRPRRPGDRPRRRHLHQSRPGAAQPVRRRRRARRSSPTRATSQAPACCRRRSPRPTRTTQQALHIGADDFVVEIQRVRLADGSPISLELAQFPAEAFPGLLEQQLGGSIYEILESDYGLVTSRADERIEAVNATPEEASLLGVKPKSALLLITRVTYDQHDTPCEFSRDLFRGDRTRLAVTVQGRGVGGTPSVAAASVALQSQAENAGPVVPVTDAPGAGRFAPSPSADLHIGNLRTAVLAWLFARSTGRRFLMRVEDLDDRTYDDVAAAPAGRPRRDRPDVGRARRASRPRTATATTPSSPTSTERGLTVRMLLQQKGYPAGAARAARAGGRLPGHLPRPHRRANGPNAAGDRPPARAAAAHRRHRVHRHDLLHGDYTGVVDDFVLRRGDGVPAYNLAVVVDDAAQGIDQVVRGDDLLSSSPRQAYLGALLGHPQPMYAHVPLVLNADGKRLAKRDGAVTLAEIGVPTRARADRRLARVLRDDPRRHARPSSIPPGCPAIRGFTSPGEQNPSAEARRVATVPPVRLPPTSAARGPAVARACSLTACGSSGRPDEPDQVRRGAARRHRGRVLAVQLPRPRDR